MNRFLYLFIVLLLAQLVTAQVAYKNFDSKKLGETRTLKIQLPRNYDSSIKSYPIILVLDGDYMFEIVAGNVDFASYWEDIPEAIVVGINQINTRDEDTAYSDQNSLPIETGASFFEFIGMELIPYIEKSYRTSPFKVVVGHGTTANFINYYLLKKNPLFNAYVSLSPDMAPDMKGYLFERLPKLSTKTFYYLATSNNDFLANKTEAEALNTTLKGIDNKHLVSTFNKFNDPTHFSLPAHAIPEALESLFFVYQPISKKEYRENILKLETSPVDYLIEKYQTIEDLFGLEKPILINDFKAIAAAIKKSKKFEYYEPLGKLARKQHPNLLLGNYYLGRFYEETGNTKKAMKTYQSAYTFEEAGGITKEHVLELSEQIKADYGY